MPEESRQKIGRINELFSRLNLQIIQEKEMQKLNKNGYSYISNIAEQLPCAEEVLFMALHLFDDNMKGFQQPNGDSYVLLKPEIIKKWYNEQKIMADNLQEDINTYLYKKYIGIDIEGCIPLCAAQDFTKQKRIPYKYLINAIRDNEIHIIKYHGDDMVNENELIGWIENKKGE